MDKNKIRIWTINTFIFLLFFPITYINAEEAPFIETQEVFFQQFIKDSNFEIAGISSLWNIIKEGDESDISADISNGTARVTVEGEQRYFTLIANPPDALWNSSQNPKFPIIPDHYEINQFGLNISHEYDESVNQTRNTPSMHWKRNISMPVDMTDYKITSASLSAIVNASGNYNLETPTDDLSGDSGYHGVDDFARFYVLLSDLDIIQEYEVAQNRTIDLGIGNTSRDSYGPISYMNDTYLDPVDENLLIFYLEKILEHDHHNFTITLGMDVYCEDNYPAYDTDTFRSLLIKSFNLTFTYQKKINQFSTLSINSVSDALMESNFEGIHTGTPSISIDNASLNFDYKLGTPWTTSSPNSELRVQINGVGHNEAIKLSRGTDTWQAVKTGGFDVTDMIQNGVNTSTSVQIFLADNFELENDIAIQVDNVILMIGYTVTWTETVNFFNWNPLIYTLAAVIVALIGGFSSYQLYFRFPEKVREIKKIKRKIRRGRNGRPIDVDSRENITKKIRENNIKSSNIRTHKTKSSESVIRTEDDIKIIAQEEQPIKKSEKKIEKTPIIKAEKKSKIVKAAEKKVLKEKKINEKKIAKDNAAVEKAATNVAKEEKRLKKSEKSLAPSGKIDEKKIVKKEDAKVKISKIKPPPKD